MRVGSKRYYYPGFELAVHTVGQAEYDYGEPNKDGVCCGPARLVRTWAKITVTVMVWRRAFYLEFDAPINLEPKGN